MKIIGLCGSSGSGKTLAAGWFSSHGVPVIDADAVYHEITGKPSACVSDLCALFGVGVVKPDGSLNRRALADIVFTGEDTLQKREKLNEITHRYVLSETERRLAAYERDGVPAVVFDAPLLFESGFDKKCDLTVCVTAPEKAKIGRIMCRDGISAAMAKARLDAQISDERLRAICTYEIANDSTPEALFAALAAFLAKIQ